MKKTIDTEINEIIIDLSSNPENNIENETVRMTITIDNNRYGAYYKCYHTYNFKIKNFYGSKKKLYHYLVDGYILPFHKDVSVKHFSNFGNKNWIGPKCINFSEFEILKEEEIVEN